MHGKIVNFLPGSGNRSETTERAMELRREQAEQRLARGLNGGKAENGTPFVDQQPGVRPGSTMKAGCPTCRA